MARKQIPIETLIMLQNSLDALPARCSKRCILVKETADLYGVSVSAIRRALREHHQPKTVNRSDYNRPRIMRQSEMKRYCELVAALKIRTSNKQGRHLSTKECIRLLETCGVETPEEFVKAPEGLLKRTTIERYLKRWGFDTQAMRVEPPVVRFQAVYSNDCWQFDFSPSDLKKLKKEKMSHAGAAEPKLMLASAVDDRSGVCYQEYHYVHGEDTMTALRFFFNAMAPKKSKDCPFQGIPKMLYMDNGPVAKSKLFKDVMNRLDVEIRSHMPKGSDGRRTTARSKGKVERPFRTVKESLETFYHFYEPETLAEANAWLQRYLQRYNAMPHRSEDHSRMEDWLKHLPPSGFREMCSWERFCAFARDPEQRKVEPDACVGVNGIRYQLTAEMAGQEVTLLCGLFDNELYVEFQGEKRGPFYPAKGPIPLDSYRRPKKSAAEKRADRIGELAQRISIPRSALSGENPATRAMLEASHVANFDAPPSIPFEKEDPSAPTAFKNKIDAKLAIAQYLGRPLATLTPAQMEAINRILSEALDKNAIMAQVRDYFSTCLEKSHTRSQ